MTNGIFGRSSGDSSPNVSLQQSLESRLRQRMDVNGSPEYDLTWKHWDMKQGEPICALRASGRRTSDSDSGGWATPTGRDHKDGSMLHEGVPVNCLLGRQVLLVAGWLADTPSGRLSVVRGEGEQGSSGPPDCGCETDRLALTEGDNRGTGVGRTEAGIGPDRLRWVGPASGSPINPWSDYDLIPCLDGKTRRVKSGLQPLAHGVPGRVGKLSAYGNAIVPQVAAEFITAFLEAQASRVERRKWLGFLQVA